MKSELTETQRKLAGDLFEIGAVKFGDFQVKANSKYPDAPLSPIYIDLRLLQAYPEIKLKAVDAYQELSRDLKFDLLAGIPTGAIAFASSLQDRLGVGMRTPRMSKKDHGTGIAVDGLLEDDHGKTVLLLDDLVTRSDSKLEAARILEEAGLFVKDVVVLIDREQGAEEMLDQSGYRLHAAMTLGSMLEFYESEGLIPPDKKQVTLRRIEEFNNYFSSV